MIQLQPKRQLLLRCHGARQTDGQQSPVAMAHSSRGALQSLFSRVSAPPDFRPMCLAACKWLVWDLALVSCNSSSGAGVELSTSSRSRRERNHSAAQPAGAPARESSGTSLYFSGDGGSGSWSCRDVVRWFRFTAATLVADLRGSAESFLLHEKELPDPKRPHCVLARVSARHACWRSPWYSNGNRMDPQVGRTRFRCAAGRGDARTDRQSSQAIYFHTQQFCRMQPPASLLPRTDGAQLAQLLATTGTTCPPVCAAQSMAAPSSSPSPSSSSSSSAHGSRRRRRVH